MRWRTIWLWWGCLGLGAVAVAGCGAADAATVQVHRPAADLERLQGRALSVELDGMIRDWAVSGDTLYLLGRTGAVARVVRTATGWTAAGHIGRAGGGPGEFLNPSGIAVTGSGDLLVLEATRLQRLSPDGTLLAAYTPRLPCVMMAPGVVAVEGGVFVHGNCVVRGVVTDTVKAVLAWSADTLTYRMTAEEVRFTRDGATGTMFGSATAFTPARDGPHVFGTGITDCVTMVSPAAIAGAGVDRQCGLVSARYSAPPPPELERRLSMRTGSAAARWPDPLPVYFDRVRAGGETILVRPFAADSVVLERASSAVGAVAVAPLDGFVGCKAEGCVWVFEDTEPMELLFLSSAELRTLVEARQ